MKKSICDLEEGEVSVILGYKNDLLPTKIFEMGLLPGVEVSILRKSPFSGPIHIATEGNSIAIRKSEAVSILVK